MKNLVLAAILALFFTGCAANKPAPAEQNAPEYRHATQIKDASCPHHGMANASCAQSHAAMKECSHHENHGADKSHGCGGESAKSNLYPKCDAKAQGCAQHKGCAHHEKSCVSDETHACPHHKH
jgi:putative lipoprotein